MKTIEEQIKELARKLTPCGVCDTNFDGVGCRVEIEDCAWYQDIYNALSEVAKLQKEIDDAALQERFEKVLNGQKWDLIDRACEWLEEHLYEEMFDLPFDNWIELFKQAMEEGQ